MCVSFFAYPECCRRVGVRPKVLIGAVVVSQVWDFVEVFVMGNGVYLKVFAFLGINAKLVLAVVFWKVYVSPNNFN